MPYILTISLGPVQDFIAASRKTRDLWFGSEMLSDMSRKVAQTVMARGGQLIFPPNVIVGDQDASVANKIVAKLSDADPATVAEEARQAAVEFLMSKKTEAVKKVRSKGVDLPPDREKSIADQINGFLEFYAAWHPVKDDDSDYKTAREEAERLLAGRKALRDFRPACGIEGVPKSSLDPGREAVIDAGKLSEEQRLSVSIKAGELLDGVSLIKRAADAKRFVSVSRVAADALIRRLDKETLKTLRSKAEEKELKDTDLVQVFDIKAFPKYDAFPYDTQLFFGEPSATEKRSLTETAAKKAKEFYKLVRTACDGEPSPYFAVLAADGDRMGELISKIDRRDSHTKLSESLAGFAKKATEILQNHSGALIYSGGDDVLAFLPLDTALQCAKHLHEEFEIAVKPHGVGKTVPSLSVGISVAHYGEHLQNLLQWARDAERSAKHHSGKNALAIHLHTRTAGETFIGSMHSWTNDPVGKRWEKWIALLDCQSLPKAAAYDLRVLARESKGTTLETDIDMLKKEARRILDRKRGERGATLMTDPDKDYILASFEGLEDLDELVNEIIIARHFVQVRQVTGDGGGIE